MTFIHYWKVCLKLLFLRNPCKKCMISIICSKDCDARDEYDTTKRLRPDAFIFILLWGAIINVVICIVFAIKNGITSYIN